MSALGHVQAAPAPRERPILFSGPLVREILADRKSQTRRLVKPRRAASIFAGGWSDSYIQDPGNREWVLSESPYGRPGDRLWVKETWAPVDFLADGYEREEPVCIGYAADRSARSCETGNAHALDTYSWNWDMVPRWRPSIHMPRWASRLTLEVTDLRVERLQAITEADILAEGVTVDRVAEWCGAPWGDMPTLHDAWRTLWDHINGERAGWAANPLVWVVSFRRLP